MHRRHSSTASTASSASASASMPPPPVPPQDYQTMLRLAHELSNSPEDSAEVRALLHSISKRQWNDMSKVKESKHVTWTRKVVVALETAIRHPNHLDSLVPLVHTFKNLSEIRLKGQSLDHRGLLIFHHWINRIPHSTSEEVVCAKHSLLSLGQTSYALLFLDENEDGSVVDFILQRVKSVTVAVARADELKRSISEDDHNEAADLIETAEKEVGEICELCVSFLLWIAPTLNMSSSANWGAPPPSAHPSIDKASFGTFQHYVQLLRHERVGEAEVKRKEVLKEVEAITKLEWEDARRFKAKLRVKDKDELWTRIVLQALKNAALPGVYKLRHLEDLGRIAHGFQVWPR
ncbi:hypothetical protein JCM3766R1_006071 [Sporobolomyces carnicolor]